MIRRAGTLIATLVVAATCVTAPAAQAGATPPPAASSVAPQPVNAQLFSAQQAARTAKPKNRITMADPDSIATRGTTYTYTTSSRQPKGCKKARKGLRVPYQKGGTATAPKLKACADGDAMPGGIGGWADPKSGVWAPSIVHYKGKYLLYYTASKRGTVSKAHPNGHKCIGVAFAKNPQGPFKNWREVACPPNGRWAIDPDAYVDPKGGLKLVYRDDAAVRSGSAISGVRMRANGSADWKTRRTLFTSSDISWDDKNATTKNIIENPSVVRMAGRYVVSFSGNNWKSTRYSTGLLDCGAALLKGTCKHLTKRSRPYFGYQGKGGIGPLRGTPWNDRGAAGMAMFPDAKGQMQVVYHFQTAHGRKARTAVINYRRGSGFHLVKERAAKPTNPPQDPQCTKQAEVFRVASINIKSNPVMNKAKVLADVRKSAHLGADVIFRQEIAAKYPWYANSVKQVRITKKGRGQWVHFHLGTEAPITVREGGNSPWSVMRAGTKTLHKGLKKVSPHRVMTWVVAKHKRTGELTAFVNTHFVSGAWRAGSSHHDWRQKMWNSSFKQMRAKIAAFHRQGISVVYGGDFNRNPMASFSKFDKRISLHGIDRIGFNRMAGESVRVSKRVTVGGFNSDHDAKFAVFAARSCR